MHRYIHIPLEPMLPDMFRHACVPGTVVNDEKIARPMNLLLMVEREAQAWPRKHHFLSVQAFNSAHRVDNCRLACARYSLSSLASDDPRFCPTSGDGLIRNCVFAGRTI